MATYRVNGMTCGGCANAVTRAIKAAAPAADVKVDLSAKTVETYRARGMEKLGLRTRAALVKFALQSGLIKRD